jgi:DNA-binding MarR family transcriptional regulator
VARRDLTLDQPDRSAAAGARQDYELNLPEFDNIIHERMRLGMVSALAVNQTLTFRELKDILGATDGNLSVHARKLEDAGYVTCHKSFAGRMPRSEYSLTPQGRKALETYLEQMDRFIRRTREG